MNLGLSIFLSSIILGIIILYIATKDRWNWGKFLKWNWKKIVVKSVVIFLVISFTSGLAIFIGYKISNIPKKMNEFLGISLNDTKDDILFLKGEPSKTNEEGQWIYTYETNGFNRSHFYIAFEDNKVRYILCLGGCPSLQRINMFSKSKKVINKFGPPSSKDISPSKKAHFYCYKKYNIFFLLEQDRVYGFGIYNPEFGPINFADQ